MEISDPISSVELVSIMLDFVHSVLYVGSVLTVTVVLAANCVLVAAIDH